MKDLTERVLESLPENVVFIRMTTRVRYHDPAWGMRTIPGIFIHGELSDKSTFDYSFKAQNFLEYIFAREEKAEKRVKEALPKIITYLQKQNIEYELF